MLDILVILAPTGEVAYCTPSFEEQLGWSRDDVLGRAIAHLVHPDDLPHVRASLRATTRGQDVPTVRLRMLHRSGEWRDFDVVASDRTRDPEVRGLVVTARDVTERRRAEDVLRRTTSRLASLIANLSASVVVEDEDRRLVLVNQPFCDLFAIPATPEALGGADCAAAAAASMHLFADPGGFIARLDAILAVRAPVVGEELAMADGRVLERDYIPIFDDGRYGGHLWLYRDISERKGAERELADARDAAVSASRQKSQFLATMSHEIRTPMNAITGLVELLRESVPVEQRETLVLLRESVESLTVVINDVLDYSKIEAGMLELVEAPFELRGRLRAMVDLYARTAEAKGLTLWLDVEESLPELVLGDAQRLRQVLLNLIGNAVKFTARGEVSVRVQRGTAPGRVRFAVEDTGAGIAPEDLDRVLEPFTQVDATPARAHGGTGLGLSITRRLVTLMGGELRVASALGTGSVFAFEVPLSTARTVVSDTPERELDTGAVAGARVLLVDDHDIGRLVGSRQLARLGVVATVVDSGAAAIEAAAAERFDAILMDCQMPGLDGYEASRRIRAAERGNGRRTPIIALTANAFSGDRQTCLDAGMDDYLAKPVALAELARILDSWVEVGTEPPGSGIVLDQAVLAGLVDDLDDPATVGLVVERFVATRPERRAAIAAAARDGDPAGLVQAAHALKGAAATLGASSLAAVCASIEAVAQTGVVVDVTTLEELDRRSRMTAAALRETLANGFEREEAA